MGLKLQSIEENNLISLNYLKNHHLFKEILCSYEDLIELLNIAIDNVEERTGLSLRKKIWKFSHNNCFINLINGPIIRIFSIVDSSKKEVPPLSITRSQENVLLQFDHKVGQVHVTYEAGYDVNTLPDCLKNSILNELWELVSLQNDIHNEVSINYMNENSYQNYHYMNRRI